MQLCVSNLPCFVLDVSLPEVSRDDLPLRVQEFLRRDDEKFESQLQEQTDEQVFFSSTVDSGIYLIVNSEWSLTSRLTHNRSFWRRVFSGNNCAGTDNHRTTK